MGVEQSSNQVRKKKKTSVAMPDYVMMAVILLIFAFGVVMVYSASFYFCVKTIRYRWNRSHSHVMAYL